LVLGKKYKVDWDAFIHAVLSGTGSAMCYYLDIFAAVDMRGVSEPLGSVQCLGPLTSLHRILPAITQGYAICDIINGFTLGGRDAISHGFATFFVMALFNEMNASHIITPMLLMEISTIVLATMKATFYTPAMKMLTIALFVLLFFITRVVMTPYIIIETIIDVKKNPGECHHPALFTSIVVFSVFFIGLNFYWFVKIIAKVHRKLSGKEKIDDLERS